MPQSGNMKIVTLNLNRAGNERMKKLADYLIGTNADAIVCTEFLSKESGEQLQSALKGAGYGSFHESGEHGSEGRVAIATRKQSRQIELQPEPVDAHRIVGCELNGIVLLGVYFNTDKEKASLFDYLLEGTPNLGNEQLIIGDFNTGRPHMDEEDDTFTCVDHFERLESEAGYVDLWRREHGEQAREFTWKEPQGGREFRLDHAFGTDALEKRVTSCKYDHSTREKDPTTNKFLLSDHSAMIVEIAPAQD